MICCLFPFMSFIFGIFGVIDDDAVIDDDDAVIGDDAHAVIDDDAVISDDDAVFGDDAVTIYTRFCCCWL